MASHSTTPSQYSVNNTDAEGRVVKNSMSIERKAGGKARAVAVNSNNIGACVIALQGIYEVI